jgi:hydroxyacylglutathione hydrolase
MIRGHPRQEFYPMFQRYFEAGLAQASYLLACDRTRDAVVIDPRRDIDIYLAAAKQRQLTIVAAIDTHIHADFLSGARELASGGSQAIGGPGSSLKFPSREARDNERMTLGTLTLRFLHTPGHTPEHISIVAEQADEPSRVFTGDTLFVGAVGRPDLLGEALMRRLAGDLHDSLFRKLLALDDHVEVHPGHGAGSLCGAGIGAEPHSTIGRERRSNPMLKHVDRDRFIAAVLGDLPDTPSYFGRMKRMNRDGPPLVGFADGYPGVPAIDAGAASEEVREGAIVIDLRDGDAFCAAHPSGAVHMAFGPRIGYWAGWVLPEDSRIVLIAANAREAAEAGRQLLRVGFDRIEGHVAGGIDAWRAAGLPISRMPQITVQQLRERLGRDEDLAVVDVRTPHEWNDGHVEGAIHVPVADIGMSAATLDGHDSVATICEGGYRSLLAASLLARAGVSNVVNVTGGMTAYRAPSP